MRHYLWICPGFAANAADTRCIPPLQMLAESLMVQGDIRLHIIALHYPIRHAPYEWQDGMVYPCAIARQSSRWTRWRKAWKYAQQIHRQHQLEGIHSFWLNDAAAVGYLLARRLQIPHWTTLMGQDVRRSNHYRHLLPVKQMELIALSPFHDDVLEATSGRRSNRIIPWGVVQTTEISTTKSRTIDVLGVGNLIKLKDYRTFIKVIAELRYSYPKLKAVLVGDGEERVKLEEYIKQLELGKHISIRGFCSRAEVFNIMQRSKVLLHPSTYESFGMVGIEAMASGMCVVSRPVGIAHASTRWHIGQSTTELLQAVDNCLAHFTPQSHIPYPMEQTVIAYRQHYYSVN